MAQRATVSEVDSRNNNQSETLMMRPQFFIREYFAGDRPSPLSFLLAQFLVPFATVFGGVKLYSWMALQVYELWALFAIALLFTALFALTFLWATVGSVRSSLKFKSIDEIKVRFLGPVSIKRALIITSLAMLLKPMSAPPMDALTVSYFLVKESALSEQSEVLAYSDRVISIKGGLTESIYTEFSRVLKQTPAAQVVLLESEGGSVFWAKRIAQQIESRSLNTHVNESCLSSCVIALFAGVERTASFYAKVGVHQGYNSVWGVDSSRDSMTEHLRKKGVSASLLRRIALYDSDDMLYPSRDELVKEGFVARFTMPHFLFMESGLPDSIAELPTGLSSGIAESFQQVIGEKGKTQLIEHINQSAPLSLEHGATLFNKLLLFSLDRHAIREPSPISVLYLKSRTKPYQFEGLHGAICELYTSGLFIPSVFFDDPYNKELSQILTVYLQTLKASGREVSLSFETRDPFDIYCR